jgi:microcystin-dependent protein
MAAGEIRLFAGNFAPEGWAICDGSMLSGSDRHELFQVIGTTYSGDGRSSVALPDFRKRIQSGSDPCSLAVRPEVRGLV